MLRGSRIHEDSAMARELPEHGTHARYRRGCRCLPCKAEHTIKCREYRAAMLDKHGSIASQVNRKGRPRKGRSCDECGAPIRSNAGNARDGRTLCAQHRRRESLATHGQRRRARLADAFVEDVDRLRVFEADGYRCHICRKMTNPARQVPHPKAPTIDHVIPLGRGGTHEPSNCRTACFSCNSSKGDRGGGEQLLLLAV
jgi:5-methylcytosine-specific restriction endonuclease McrA